MARKKLTPEEVVRREQALKCGIFRQLAVIWTKSDFERHRLNPEYSAPLRRKPVTAEEKPFISSKKADLAAKQASPQIRFPPPPPPLP